MSTFEWAVIGMQVLLFLGLGLIFNIEAKRLAASNRLEALIRSHGIWLEQILADQQRELTHTLRIDGRLNRQEIYRRNLDSANYPVTNEDDMLKLYPLEGR